MVRVDNDIEHKERKERKRYSYKSHYHSTETDGRPSEREKGENRKPYEALTYKICENPTFRFVFVQFQSYRGSAVSESGEVYSVEPG